MKSYKKPFTRLVEEGTLISCHGGELLNSKNEWHQAKIVRSWTSINVMQGGAELLRGGGGGGAGRPLGGRIGARTQGQWGYFLGKWKWASLIVFLFGPAIVISLDQPCFYQKKWPGSLDRNSFLNKFIIIRTSQPMDRNLKRKAGVWLDRRPWAGSYSTLSLY